MKMNKHKYTQCIRRKIAGTSTEELELILAIGYKEVLSELTKRHQRKAIQYANNILKK